MGVKRLALAACVNAGLSEVDAHLDTTRGVDEHGIHDDAPMTDLTGDIKQEMGNGASGSNDDNDTVPPLSHQSIRDDSSDGEDNDVDEEYSGPVFEPTSLCGGPRMRRQAKHLVPTHKG